MPPTKRMDLKWIVAIVLAVIFVPVLIFWGGDILTYCRTSSIAGQFQEADLQNYHAQALEIIAQAGGEDKAPATPARAGKSLLIEKKVIVRSSSNEISLSVDRDQGRLPPHLRAENPGAVQTVALCIPNSYRALQTDYRKVSETKDKKGNVMWVTVMRTQYRSSEWSESLDIYLVDIKRKKYLGRQTLVWDIDTSPGSSLSSHPRDSAKFMEWYEALVEN